MEQHGLKNEREGETNRKYNVRILSAHKILKYVNIILVHY